MFVTVGLGDPISSATYLKAYECCDLQETCSNSMQVVNRKNSTEMWRVYYVFKNICFKWSPKKNYNWSVI